MFSLVDALVSMRTETILDEMHLEGPVREALLNASGPLRPLLDVSLVYEKGAWARADKLGSQMGLDEGQLSEIYFSSVEWAQEMIGLTATDDCNAA
jgi:EAL and modified HD-GYP domain-containing signal transduction protein